jgi:hypothetical protein
VQQFGVVGDSVSHSLEGSFPGIEESVDLAKECEIGFESRTSKHVTYIWSGERHHDERSCQLDTD